LHPSLGLRAAASGRLPILSRKTTSLTSYKKLHNNDTPPGYPIFSELPNLTLPVYPTMHKFNLIALSVLFILSFTAANEQEFVKRQGQPISYSSPTKSCYFDDVARAC
jgi:hypothetical protein